MTIEERWARIEGTTHIVRIENMEVYRIKKVRCLDDILFVETESDLCFQDLDVMTLEERASMEKQMNYIKDFLL